MTRELNINLHAITLNSHIMINILFMNVYEYCLILFNNNLYSCCMLSYHIEGMYSAPTAALTGGESSMG